MSAQSPAVESFDVVAAYPAAISRQVRRRMLIVLGLVFLGAGAAACWLLFPRAMTYTTWSVGEQQTANGVNGTIRVPVPALLYAPTAAGPGDIGLGLSAHVWVLRAGKPVPIAVILGPERDNQVEVSGHIEPGDEVIVAEHSPSEANQR